jgi:hypothetical protein
MEQHNNEETALETQDELEALILAYLPPIPNSQGYECRGTVAETLADVIKEEILKILESNEVKREEILKTLGLSKLEYDKKLRFVSQLEDAHREILAKAEYKVEWQVRMVEDRGSEVGWQNNTEIGAIYLEREHGAEVRTRVVSEWKTRG